MAGLNRHACFNELSVKFSTVDKDNFDMFIKYAKTIRTLKEKGFTGIRYSPGMLAEHTDLGSKVSHLKSSPIGRNIHQLILSTSRQPYIDPDSSEEDRYISEDYEVCVGGLWKEGEGFTSAYLYETVAVSLESHDVWLNESFDLRQKGVVDWIGRVINATSKFADESKTLDGFIEDKKPIDLKPSKISPMDKKWSFRDDHGTDKLMALWKRIRNCDYVVEAINSLAFDSQAKNFIEKCFEDGKIYIRLTNSDKGYGMVIQTTGSDLKSTIAIGEILNKNYAP